MRIDLTPEDVDLATAWATEVERLAAKRGDNYTGISEPARYFNGYLGELAIARWLTSAGRLFQHRVWMTGRREAAEFVVWKQGEPKHLDVKCTSKPDATIMMMPAAQAVDSAVYVACRLLQDGACPAVSIDGWVTGAVLKTAAVKDFGKGLTRYMPHVNLQHPNALIDALDGVRQVQVGKVGRRVAA